MAEVQTNTQTGELAQRFIEFVMMQAQNAALFLGQIPNPQSGEGEVNLELARMFIDQLSMIQEKTRGNLGKEEEMVLRNTLTNLQMAFVEVSQNGPTAGSARAEASAPMASSAPEPPSSVPAPEASTSDAPTPAEPAAETESRKKFTKSYGA
ncbi:MAG: DUF1844 domain-containing protein [Verrucomicrobiota bacterium]|nr:DUF1844 domain-containing protein [Verrucomicrobiota bacterium]